MNHSSEPDTPPPACDACPFSDDRRAFLKDMGLAALGALIMVGMPPELAARATFAAITPSRLIRRNPSYPIPAQDGVQIDRNNQIILVRWKNIVYAFNLACPHQHVALRWNDHDQEFQCPKHHSKYQPDGTFISGRATRGMDRFSIARNGGEIVVDVDAMHKNDADPAGWSAASIDVSGG